MITFESLAPKIKLRYNAYLGRSFPVSTQLRERRKDSIKVYCSLQPFLPDISVHYSVLNRVIIINYGLKLLEDKT